MLGPEGVTRGLHEQLTDTVPRRLAALRKRLRAAPADLPDVRKIYPDEVDVLSIEKFPALVITTPDTDGKLTNRQTELGSASEEYSYRYNIRVFVYVIAADTMATSRLIKRMTLGVREALLTRKILVDDLDRAEIDPQTIRESYSEVESGKRGFIAAAFVEFQVVTHETLDVLDLPDGLVEIEAEIVPTPTTDEHFADDPRFAGTKPPAAAARHPYFDE